MTDDGAEQTLNVWENEDGDTFFADIHMSIDEMSDLVTSHVEAVSGEHLTAAHFADAHLRHYWTVEDPDDDERYLLVGKSTPCATAMTQLYLPNRNV